MLLPTIPTLCLVGRTPHLSLLPSHQVSASHSFLPFYQFINHSMRWMIFLRVCCTLYLGHLPNDFCVTSPTKLLHFPNNLLRFPNKIASFPQQLESLPQQLVSLPQHIFSFPQQLCVTLPPAKKSFFFNFTCFSYLNIPASF